MPENYILLETIALTQSAASVTFDNLPTSGYTDLKIVCSVRSDRTSSTWDYINLTLNGSSSSYSYRYISGNGSAAASGSLSLLYGGDIPATGATSSTFCNSEFYIPNYRSTTTAKSISFDLSAENNATAGFLYLGAGLWNPGTQAAVTSITLTSGNAVNFVANSTFSLYGIAALGTTPVLAPKAEGGNIVANDGTYWYHAFTSSGNFVPQVGLTANVLVIAGGGAGATSGGGGGAGGLLLHSSQSLANGTNYTCTIGAGGSGMTGNNGSNGVNSQFGALTASVGGGGGARDDNPGANGGSGGGGGLWTGTAGVNLNGGLASPSGQGNAGGDGGKFSGSPSGGGGGAGAVGGAGTSGLAGAGGAGVNTYSSWATATNTGVSGFYAGGGGGATYNVTAGAGGSGGGGAGTTANVGIAAIVNTGSGGGGGGYIYAGGNGGAGIIIIRYPIAS